MQFVVAAGGSTKGIESVARGDVDIGMVSRELSDAEKRAWPDLVRTRIAADAVAIVVNAANPLKDLARSRVVDVFTGAVTNWKSVGGPDAAIDLVTPGGSHGTLEVFGECFDVDYRIGAKQTLTFKRAQAGDFPSTKARALNGNKAVLAAVVTSPHAIGIVSYASARTSADNGAAVKLLSLEGVIPSEESILSGAYAERRALDVLTKGRVEGDVAAFIAFLRSPRGQAIVKELDYLPVGPDEGARGR